MAYESDRKRNYQTEKTFSSYQHCKSENAKKKKKTILSTIKILRKALLEKDGVQLSD